MARSSKGDGEGSVTEATTLIFPKKSAWDELLEAKRTAKKRAASANGTYSKVVTRLVEDEHMDRRAARMVAALDAIEDDSDLHVTVHHLIDGMRKTGVMKRALAQEEMFDEHKIDEQVSAKGAAKTKGKGKAKGEPDMTNVTSLAQASRDVLEQAGVS